MVRLQQGFATNGMGFRDQVERHNWAADAQIASEMVRSVYGWFTEGFDTPDLKDAKACSKSFRGPRKRSPRHIGVCADWFAVFQLTCRGSGKRKLCAQNLLEVQRAVLWRGYRHPLCVPTEVRAGLIEDFSQHVVLLVHPHELFPNDLAETRST